MKNARRRLVGALVGTVAVFPLSALLQLLRATDMPKLSPDDSTARSLNYTHTSADAEKPCSNCQFYTVPSAVEWGTCVVFPEKVVSAKGLCNSWFKRAG